MKKDLRGWRVFKQERDDLLVKGRAKLRSPSPKQSTAYTHFKLAKSNYFTSFSTIGVDETLTKSREATRRRNRSSVLGEVQCLKSRSHSRSLKNRVLEYEEFLTKIKQLHQQLGPNMGKEKRISHKICNAEPADNYYLNLIGAYADKEFTGIKFISKKR